MLLGVFYACPLVKTTGSGDMAMAQKDIKVVYGVGVNAVAGWLGL
jgi:hypothetical protein